MAPSARSTATLHARVATLEAIEDVRDLFRRYTWALDHADFDGIAACFTADGSFAFQDAVWEGRAAIRGYFEEDRRTHTDMLHYPVNVVVDVIELDEERGQGQAIADATLWDLFNRLTPNGKEGACLAGWYRLHARQRDGEWAIERLEVTARWVVGAPVWQLGADFQARPDQRTSGG